MPKNIANLRSKIMLTFSFSTIDNKIAKLFESNAPNPERRIEWMKKSKKKVFLVGVSLMSMLLYTSDSEEVIEEIIISTFKNVGVDHVFLVGLTLFGNTDNDSKIKYIKF